MQSAKWRAGTRRNKRHKNVPTLPTDIEPEVEWVDADGNTVFLPVSKWVADLSRGK